MSNERGLTVGERLFALIDSNYRALLWIRDMIAPRRGQPVIEALKAAGHVTTVQAIIDNLPSRPRSTKIQPQCRSIHISGNDIGVLFVHGFGSSPETMRELAEYVHTKGGFTCRVARLAGHGTSVEDMERTTFIDWYKSVKFHYDDLLQHTKEVLVVGHSMGATLALLLASQEPVKAIVALSPPIKLHRPDAKYLPLITWFMRYWPTKKSEAQAYEQRGHFYYKHRPLKCVTSLFELMEVTRPRLPKVRAPLLAAIGLQDPRVTPKNIELLFKLAGSATKEMVVFENSRHSLHHGSEKQQVLETVAKWLQEQASN